MGGEKRLRRQCARRYKGSPPRGRGKDSIRNESAPLVGITPAWAGKSAPLSVGLYLVGDHPRVGGEKSKVPAGQVLPQGSPPRGRGKVLHRRKQKQRNRITPAWAGKSHSAVLRRTSKEDHPRVGGEKNDLVTHCLHLLGSPPRGRGKDSSPVSIPTALRITPAWAGKRYTCCYASRAPTDHPRVGGEKETLKAHHKGLRGSPPRGRGKASGSSMAA